MTLQETMDGRIDHEREASVPTDVDFEPVTSEDADYTSAPADYKITAYPADFTLEVLHQKWKAGEFVIPDFQRSFVWKPDQSSKLIESFLVGLPVPPVFLYREMESERYLVIDGQQRLKSIVFYIEGFFGEGDQRSNMPFRLTGLSPTSIYAGKQYSELLDETRWRLNNAVLRSIVVQQLDPDDDTSIYHIFERLNTGGVSLSNQEIRTSLFHGSFAETLDELNRWPAWRSILGQRHLDSRKKDIELIVRFFAMRDLSGYRKPLKDFLSKFMKEHQNSPPESLESEAQLFRNTCDSILGSLGAKPFHVRNGLSVSTTDAVMVTFSRHLDEIPQDVADRYRKLKHDEEFRQATIQWTTDVDNVKLRFRRVEEVLFK